MILPNGLTAAFKIVGGVRAAIFLSLLLVVSGMSTFQHFHIATLKKEVAQVALKNEQAQHRYDQEKAATERKHVEETAAIALKTEQERKHAQEAIAKLNADVKSGRLQLRDKFVCKTGRSEIGPITSGPTASDGTILSDEDQQFLIQQANAADEAVRQRNEAVEIAKKDRGQ